MVHYWAKLLDEEQKMIAQATVEHKRSLPGELLPSITTLCGMLDIPTPLILNKHMQQFSLYRSATFLPADFVEKVLFSKMIVEIY